MGYSFTEWLECPTCDEGSDVKILAHSTDIVLECYDCGQISEFEVGTDIPFKNLSPDAIESSTGE